jgi:diaminopimelate epimerase
MKQSSIQFAKMHGLGNDFVVINAVDQIFDLQQISINELADRHRGIGFDQLLLIEPSERADYFCRIFNSDGSEAEQCGNGLRCVARYIHEAGMNNKQMFSLETKAGIYPLVFEDYDHIRVTMGTPEIREQSVELELQDNAGIIELSILSVGNPHAIVKVASLDDISPEKLGAAISCHSYFPQGANVGFMVIRDSRHIQLRTFERGAGITNACGSNACAATVAGIANGWLEKKVNVEFRYGSLVIEWDGSNSPVQMTGPASLVYSGHILL